MTNHIERSGPVRAPLAFRAAVYVIALAAFLMLLREARVLVVPVLFALFLAMLGAPIMGWLRRLRVPIGIAAIVVVLGMAAVLMLSILIITTSAQALSSRIPEYQAQFDRQVNMLLTADETELSWRALLDTIDPGSGLGFLAGLLTDALTALGNVFIILIIAAFMLVEGSVFSEKLRAAFGDSPDRDRRLARFMSSLARYAGLKSLMCILTGLLIGLFVWIIGLDLALLLGYLAFVLNYIPNIGSFVAAVPALLLAFVQLGPGGVIGVAIGYLVINTLVSNVIEPRVMGEGLGISPLVVFLSVLGAGWTLGPIGVILSIPLVMVLQLALEANPGTRRMALLLQSASAVREAVREAEARESKRA